MADIIKVYGDGQERFSRSFETVQEARDYLVFQADFVATLGHRVVLADQDFIVVVTAEDAVFRYEVRT